MNALAFATPAVLAALAILPAIWWLLRITPPRPEREVFPPFRILARLTKREETPENSPWWLTALRILLAAAVILAMAGPVLNPRQDGLSAAGPLVLVIDNSWAAANDWAERQALANDLMDQAESAGLPVSMVLTAGDRQDATPGSAASARARLAAARPQPVPADRGNLARDIRAALDGTAPGSIILLSDGVASGEKDRLLDDLTALKPAEVRLVTGKGGAAAIADARNVADGLQVTATRLPGGPAVSLELTAFDGKGRAIASGTLPLGAGATGGQGLIRAPLEIRNDVVRITMGPEANAGTVRLLDEGSKRRRVGILGGDDGDTERPLLSPVYYVRRALQPFADLTEPRTTDMAAAIDAILADRPSVIVMADVGKVPAAAARTLDQWIRSGGTLIRFAGPQLAAASASDMFATVPLRQGERSFGGVLSWNEPQTLAPFPADGPFAGMAAPSDVHVMRQVLAEPSPDLARNTLASLSDGTPLVTTRAVERGSIVLFHVSAEPSWSDLPLSGTFVDMLRQLVQLSRSSLARPDADGKPQPLPPYRLLTAEGTLSAASGGAEPLIPARDMKKPADRAHPPGLYGSEEGYVAHNLLLPGTRLTALDPGAKAAPWLKRQPLAGPQPVNLVAPAIALALALLLLDGLAVLFLNGALRPMRRAAAALLLTAALGGALAALPHPVLASDEKPGDADLLKRLDTTHLAYVKTGEAEVDEISRQGLYGLTQFLTFRTALEPGLPEAVDIAKDELSVFPLIYWPVSASAPMPDAAAIGRIGAYMRAGGSVLFDTRDQSEQAFGADAVTANGERLRQILADLDIPPLEPVPRGHVLTRAFYLMNSFPGRYADSPLWVEAGQGADRKGSAAPVSADGVSPILITANDLAGAWAIDELGNPQLPTVPPDENQREYAFRAGVNIMMYMLTGNYKGDQVHVPALLERLGN